MDEDCQCEYCDAFLVTPNYIIRKCSDGIRRSYCDEDCFKEHEDWRRDMRFAHEGQH